VIEVLKHIFELYTANFFMKTAVHDRVKKILREFCYT
jgi:hypothetical protein